MHRERKEWKEPEKIRQLRSLGGSLRHLYDADGHFLDDVWVDRMQHARRDRRDAKMWVVALASAVASAISAVAAWTAVLMRLL